MSTLTRRTPLRSTRKVPRAERVDVSVRGRCSRCPQPAEILRWCRGCAKAVADELLSRFVKGRDRKCVRCGTRYELTMAHILGRARVPRIRWDERNVAAACWPCHEMLDTHPDYKRDFFERLYPGRQEMLRELAPRLPRPDLVEIIQRLSQAAA